MKWRIFLLESATLEVLVQNAGGTGALCTEDTRGIVSGALAVSKSPSPQRRTRPGQEIEKNSERKQRRLDFSPAEIVKIVSSVLGTTGCVENER